jgi:hypothetical protein
VVVELVWVITGKANAEAQRLGDNPELFGISRLR